MKNRGLEGSFEVLGFSRRPLWSWPVLAHVGAMLRHYWQQDGCQDHHLGDQERPNEPRWFQRGCKIEPRWHPGLRIRGLEGSGEVLGVSWRPFWTMLARSWPVLAHVGAMLHNLGSKMAAKMAVLAIRNAKMSQDGAQEDAKLS